MPPTRVNRTRLRRAHVTNGGEYDLCVTLELKVTTKSPRADLRSAEGCGP